MGKVSKQEEGGSAQEKWKRERGRGIWSIWLCNEVSVQKKKASPICLINSHLSSTFPITFCSSEEVEVYKDVQQVTQEKIHPLERTATEKVSFLTENEATTALTW